MQIKLDVPTSEQVRGLIDGLRGTMAKAMTAGMREAADGFKDQIRGQVRQNFKRTPPYARRRGLDFEKSFQAEAYPSQRSGKSSLNPAAFFVAKAKAAESFEQDTGVAGRRYLAIALPAARKLKLDYRALTRGTVGTFGKSTDIEALKDRFGSLRLLPTRGGNLLLAADRKQAAKEGLKPRGKNTFVPLVLLAKAVRLPKKLDFKATAKRWAERVTGLIERRLDRGA